MYKQKTIIFLYSTILPLHMLNTLSIGSVKLFYIPVFILGIIGIFQLPNLINSINKHCNNTLKYLLLFVISSALSIIYVLKFDSYFTLVLLFLAMLPIRTIDTRKLYPIASFLFVIALILSYRMSNYSETMYRYQGQYNDPNYFVTSIILGIFFCIQSLKTTRSKVMKLINILSIIYALYTILLTQSRGGILALLIFALCVLYTYLRKNIKSFVFVSILLVIAFSFLQGNELVEQVQNRFKGENQNDVSSSMSRFYEAEAAFKGIQQKPIILFIGAGIGTTGEENEYLDSFTYDNPHRIHNTLVAVLFENGIIPFVFFCLFLWVIIKQTYRIKDKIYLGLTLAVIVQSLTIWIIPYIPFWLAMAFCMKAKEELLANQ